MNGLLWGIYRLCGLACLGLAAQIALLIAAFETTHVARADQWPYLATCLALLCGGLLVLPSTTPIWIKHVRSRRGAGIAIVTILAVCAIISQAATLILGARPTDLIAVAVDSLIQGVSVMVVVAVLCIGGLGLTAPRGPARTVPLMEATATHCQRLPRLPSASRYS
jgi:hypothetical protein